MKTTQVGTSESSETNVSPPNNINSPTQEDHSAGSGSYQVVARRYRPKTFEELVGQKHIAHALSNALTTGRVGHAYLFTGARGVGKTSTARIFAKSLNCVNGPTLEPCGDCDSCRSVSTGEDIDVLEIDGASNRGIDEIRQLRQNASICPSRSKFKIYIIDEVHMLTREAFNALLKILEEPPEHVKFIFCTTEPSKIPITILSRCQRFDFAGIETTAISQRLAGIAANEHVTADDGVFPMLARRAAGSMRDAQSLLEQLLSFAPEHISLADVHEMLGTANDQLLFRLLDAMLRCEPAIIFAELETAASEGVDFGVMVEQMIGLLRDLLVVASGGDAMLMLFCSTTQFDQVKSIANTFGLHRILASLQILDQTHTKMRFSTQGRILTELALIRIAHLDHFQMITVLLDRIREGNLAFPATPTQTPTQTITQTIPAVAPIAPAVKPVQRVIPPPSQIPIPAQSVPASAQPVPVSTQSIPSSTQPAPEVRRSSSPNSNSVNSVSQTSGQTPLQRFNEASAIPKIDLETMTDEKAVAVWRDAIDTIPGMLATYAANYKKLTFEKPNGFFVVFDNRMAKEFCERESPRLLNALSQAIGKAIRIRFELIEEKQPAPTPTQEVNRNQLFKDVVENPFVKKIGEIFGAELYDVR
ncbi:MAG: DNA polymerase III subunit gamma/tau [Planctomycetaceae bacterium]|jgi:DNA polymerase-3 subunit gamma/tau|nr:DNA polymerase III subunit gamma/tau [Planctomycetaceae bacterium]